MQNGVLGISLTRTYLYNFNDIYIILDIKIDAKRDKKGAFCENVKKLNFWSLFACGVKQELYI